MADKREIQAPTLEEAVREAARTLGVAEHAVHYRLIDEGRRGVMGIGQRDVRIEIELAPPSPAAPTAPPVEDRGPAAPARTGPAARTESPAPRTEPGEDDEDRRGNLRRTETERDERRGNRRGGPPADGGERRGGRRSRRGGRGGRGRGGDGPARAERAPAERRERPRREPSRTPKVETGPPMDIAPESMESFRTTVQELVGGLDLDLAVHVAATPSGVRVDLDGPDVGRVQDQDSEFQSGLQFLLNRMSRRAFPDVGRITVGPQFERYSERDEELIAEVHEIAGQVQRTGLAKTLHPMNPYERRLVHLTVREYEGLESHSEGDGFLKTVTVSKS